ncbi:MAG: response regulator transcription factor, partial [Chryseobacterium gambrini]|nr:response regulator transcription factor [Chryseobacterium gambrini]
AYTEEEALEKFKSFSPDIILMDINIDGIDKGIDLAEKRNKNAKIIFITAQNDEKTVEKAIKVKPETYLTKPVKKVDILAAIRIVLLKKSSDYIILKDGYENIKILKSDIIFIKSDKNYIDIHTVSKKYTFRISLENFAEILNDTNFQRVHRCYIINIKKAVKKTRLSVFVENYEIPLSRNIIFDLDIEE